MTISVVAENTKRLIKDRGLLQKKVARDCGYTEKRFSDLINGRKIITAEDVMKITKGLSVEPNDLFCPVTDKELEHV